MGGPHAPRAGQSRCGTPNGIRTRVATLRESAVQRAGELARRRACSSPARCLRLTVSDLDDPADLARQCTLLGGLSGIQYPPSLRHRSGATLGATDLCVPKQVQTLSRRDEVGPVPVGVSSGLRT